MNLFLMFTHVSISHHYCYNCDRALFGKKLFSSLDRWLELLSFCRRLFPACTGSSHSGSSSLPLTYDFYILFTHRVPDFGKRLISSTLEAARGPSANKQTNKNPLKKMGPHIAKLSVYILAEFMLLKDLWWYLFEQ